MFTCSILVYYNNIFIFNITFKTIFFLTFSHFYLSYNSDAVKYSDHECLWWQSLKPLMRFDNCIYDPRKFPHDSFQPVPTCHPRRQLLSDFCHINYFCLFLLIQVSGSISYLFLYLAFFIQHAGFWDSAIHPCCCISHLFLFVIEQYTLAWK